MNKPSKASVKKFTKSKEYHKYIKFLNENKHLVGLTDWSMIVGLGVVGETNFAEVGCDILEKELKIGISEEFRKESNARKANILMHELIHGRITVFNEELNARKNLEEEKLTNDLTRGIERIKVLKI